MMKNPTTIDNHFVQLKGKANIPEPLKIDEGYHISVEGSITDVKQSANHDGSFDYSYVFNPIKVEILDERGHIIKAKDTRSRSSQLRARLYVIWSSSEMGGEFEDFYDKFMVWLLKDSDNLFARFKIKK